LIAAKSKEFSKAPPVQEEKDNHPKPEPKQLSLF
jgi:hypothetical protein